MDSDRSSRSRSSFNASELILPELKLRFKGSGPNFKETMWGKKVAKANWAGAYYCLVPKRGSVFRHGSIQRFLDFPVDPLLDFQHDRVGEIGLRRGQS